MVAPLQCTDKLSFNANNINQENPDELPTEITENNLKNKKGTRLNN